MHEFWQWYFRLAQITWEANAVITMRMLRIAAGGSLAQREMQRMVTEKGGAIGEAAPAGIVSTIKGSGMADAAKPVSNTYRRKVRSNRRRLSRH
jgi:hypothetical protein